MLFSYCKKKNKYYIFV